MRFLILILLSFSLVHPSNYVSINLISKIDAKYGKFAKNRFIALKRLMDELQGKEELEKIKQINIFFNNVPYMSDIKAFGLTDYWATPSEFLGKDRGDCEDYVIAKYFALKNLGVPTSKMYLTYVQVKNYSQAHMVLSYFPTPKSQPYVLDNLNRLTLLASKRKDLTPVFNFNPNVLNDGKRVAAHKKWDTLMKNIKENRI